MHMDPILPVLVGAIACLLLVGLLLRAFRQPHVLAYLLAGIALGPQGFGIITHQETLHRVGEAGVILLLFFVGMEVSIPRLLAGWRIAILGTLFQILGSIACVWALGAWLDWPAARIVLLGFAISLSSTAVVLSMLRTWGILGSQGGQDALGILIVQDVAVIPMLIVLGLMAGESSHAGTWVLQALGGVLIVLLIIWIGRGGQIRLPFGAWLQNDFELQVFGAILLCFGIACLTGFLGLSTALGAFVAGVLVAAARETEWVHRSLESFRVLFLALFFASVGMLLDPRFVLRNWGILVALVVAVLATNTIVNALLLRMLGRGWRTSFFVGALLAQIGEFSFVIAAVGLQAGIISQFAYQGVLTTIALTLALSPAWVAIFSRLRPRILVSRP